MSKGLAPAGPFKMGQTLAVYVPESAPAGAEIEIFGTDFRPAYSIGIGDARVMTVSLTSDRIVARVPDIPAGSYNINVINSAGRIATVGPSFTVLAAGMKITGVAPACGSTDGEAESATASL